MSEFTESKLDNKLSNLTGSDSSIKQLSGWIISHRSHFQVIGATLYKVLVRTNKDKTLIFLYLVNEIVRRSKNKHPEFIVEFGNIMKKVLEYLVESNYLDEKTKSSIWELIKGWRRHQIFDINKQDDLENMWKESIREEANTSKREKSRSTSPKDFPQRRQKPSKLGQDLYCDLCQEDGHVSSEGCHTHALCRNCGIKGHIRKDCPRLSSTELEKTKNERTKENMKEEQRIHERNENFPPKLEGKTRLKGNSTVVSNDDDDVIFLKQKVGGPTIPIVTITLEESEEQMEGTSLGTHLQHYDQKNDTHIESASLGLNSTRIVESATVGTKGGPHMEVEQLPCTQNSMCQEINHKSIEDDSILLKEQISNGPVILGIPLEENSKKCQCKYRKEYTEDSEVASKEINNSIKKRKTEENDELNGFPSKSYGKSNLVGGDKEHVEVEQLQCENSHVPPKIERIESLASSYFEVNNNISDNDDVIFMEEVAIQNIDSQQCNQEVAQNESDNTIPSLMDIPMKDLDRNLLHFAVHNVHHPINVDVMDKICSNVIINVGKVLRIDMLAGRGVQCMVEFDSEMAAKQAKDSLHGTEIYEGSCTLNVEYVTKGEYKNDETSCNIATGFKQENNCDKAGNTRGTETDRNKEAIISEAYGNYLRDNRNCVVMIYTTIPKKMNCNILFNLFSQYGNVNRVVFMANKEGCAMLEMEDPESAVRAIRYLNHVKLFGCRLQLDMSRRFKTLATMKTTFQLPDGSQAIKEYYRHHTSNSSLLFNAPSKSLHFQNLPKSEVSEIGRLFRDNGAPRPSGVRWFPAECENSLSHMGLMEFRSIEESCKALALVNHVEVMSSQINQKFPTKMNLSFAPPTYSV